LVRLMARQQSQIGRDIEACLLGQPVRVVGEGAVLAAALPGIGKRADQHPCLADADLDLAANHWRSAGHHSAPERPSRLLLRTRLGTCSSISIRPMSSWGVSSSFSRAWISPKTCRARA